MSEKPDTFLPLNVAVLTISDSRTLETDDSGALLAERIGSVGHRLRERLLEPDHRYRIRAVVSQWIADEGVDAIITTGGTGLTGRDGTPEAVEPLLDKQIEGFGEMFRVLSYEDIGTSTLQSRCLAGLANGTFVFCLPGSRNAVATGWDQLIEAQLDTRTRPCNLAELRPRLRDEYARKADACIAEQSKRIAELEAQLMGIKSSPDARAQDDYLPSENHYESEEAYKAALDAYVDGKQTVEELKAGMKPSAYQALSGSKM